MKRLLLELNRFYPVSAALEEFIYDKVTIRTFRKSEVILKVGQICRYCLFHRNGRGSACSGKGREGAGAGEENVVGFTSKFSIIQCGDFPHPKSAERPNSRRFPSRR